MWVEILYCLFSPCVPLSSSSWGCELKWDWGKVIWQARQSSSSWGCELKYVSWSVLVLARCHPLREDVSWNSFEEANESLEDGHPLREDVSWNKENGDGICRTRRSSSSWGCDLKYPTDSDQETGSYRHPLREDVSWNKEVADIKTSDQCHPLREDVSWNDKAVRAVEMCQVILFVRMWVEILKSTVLIIVVAIWFFLWGGELKYPW